MPDQGQSKQGADLKTYIVKDIEIPKVNNSLLILQLSGFRWRTAGLKLKPPPEIKAWTYAQIFNEYLAVSQGSF